MEKFRKRSEQGETGSDYRIYTRGRQEARGGEGGGSLARETSDGDGSNRAAQPSIVGTDFNLVNPSLNLGDVIFPTFSVL